MMRDISTHTPVKFALWLIACAFLLFAGGVLILGSALPQLWLGIPAGLLLLYSMGRNPAVWLAVFFLLYPLESVQESLTSLSLPSATKIIGAGLFCVCLVRMFILRDGRRRLWPPAGKYIALWLALLLMGLASSIDLGLSRDQLRMIFPGLILFFVTINIVRTREDFLRMARVLAVSGTLACSAALMARFLSHSDGRLIGFMADPNFFASLFIVSFPLVAREALRGSGKRALFWSGAALLHVVVVLQTQSRSALLVLFLEALCFLPELRRRLSGRGTAHAAIAAALLAVLAATFAPSGLAERLGAMTSAPSAASDASLARRASYLRIAFANAADHPLLGSGIGTYPRIYAQESVAVALASSPGDIYRYAHNTYVEMLSDTGLPGALAFLAVMLSALAGLRRQRKAAVAERNLEDALFLKALLLSFAGLLLMLATISASFHKELWLLIALAATAERYRAKDAAGEAAGTEADHERAF